MLKTLASASAIVLAMANAAAAQETTIRFSDWLPPTHPVTTEMLRPWAAKVEEATEGRVKVQFIPALGKPQAHFDLVRDGVADAGMSVQAYTADRFPSAYGFTLPGYAADATTASVAYWRTYDEMLKPLGEFEDVHLLGLWAHGPAHVFTSNDEVKTMDDLDGLRLRATGGIVQDVSERLGIVPQFSSASEAYELLTRGVVDGVMFNSDSVYSFNLQDGLKYAYRVPGGLYRDVHYVIMNKDTYNSLSEADRAAIDRVSGEALARLAGEAWDRVEGEAWEKMEASDYTINEASEEDVAHLLEVAEPLKQAWIARMKEQGADGEAILETFAGHVSEVQAETSAQ
ncbi:TRAP transporter substrate-binding protein [Amorphus sp. MBR-141]